MKRKFSELQAAVLLAGGALDCDLVTSSGTTVFIDFPAEAKSAIAAVIRAYAPNAHTATYSNFVALYGWATDLEYDL